MQSQIVKEIDSQDWNKLYSSNDQAESAKALENGSILLLPKLAFHLLPHEEKFLSPSYANKKTKNISFNYQTGLLRGTDCVGTEHDELKAMLQRFMYNAHQLIQHIFPLYTSALHIGRTSFRPVEISGRASSYRKDDTRLHVDAFPATPNQGWRILRVFTNINSAGQSRLWRVGEPFVDVAQRFLPQIGRQWIGKARLLKIFNLTKSYRTEYDHIMLQIHNRMKADLNYQKTVPQHEIYFAPGNSWIVQTDHVSHAAMAGQHILEQTFHLPVHAMMNPECSPLRTLEKLSGRALI